MFLFTQIAYASTVSVNNGYVCIKSNEKVYTVSITFKNAENFAYLPNWLVLNVSEYNSPTIKTAGYEGGFTGEKCLGYAAKGISIKNVLILDENGNNTYTQ